MSRAPRYRTLPEKVGSIVLACEALICFLAGLVMYGLGAVPAPLAPWWGIVAGVAMLVLLLATAGTLRWPWGRATGWALQAVIAAGALVVPAILLITIVFGSMWAYAMIGGSRIERRVQAARAEADAAGETPAG